MSKNFRVSTRFGTPEEVTFEINIEANKNVSNLLEKICESLHYNQLNAKWLRLKVKQQQNLLNNSALLSSIASNQLEVVYEVQTRTGECQDCFEEKNLIILPCNHAWCLDCLVKKLLNIQNENLDKSERLIYCGFVSGMNCAESCKEGLFYEWFVAAHIKSGKNQKAFDRKLEEKLSLISLLRTRHSYCPSCGWVNVGDSKMSGFPHVACGNCSTNFCFFCQNQWTSGGVAGEKCGHKSCVGDAIKMIALAMANEKRYVNLSANGSAPYVKTEVPAFRFCPKCAGPCDSGKGQGCKHTRCPTCGYYFCALCLRHESICLHQPDYYFRFCGVPIAPLQVD